MTVNSVAVVDGDGCPWAWLELDVAKTRQGVSIKLDSEMRNRRAEVRRHCTVTLGKIHFLARLVDLCGRFEISHENGDFKHDDWDAASPAIRVQVGNIALSRIESPCLKLKLPSNCVERVS